MAEEEKKTETGATPEEKPTTSEVPAQEAAAGEVKAEEAHPERQLKKPLDRMTAKELREVAAGIPGVAGVHAMKKEELLAVIRKAWDISEKPPQKGKEKKIPIAVADLKKRIHALKAKRAEAIQSKEKKMSEIYRRMINRLKKRTRRAA